MAINSAQVAINNSTPTLIYPADSDGVDLCLDCQNNPVFLGNATVTKDTGYRLGTSENISLSLAPNELLYGITGTGSAIVYVLAVKNQ